VHSGFDKQLSKWIARLSFTSLRARLLLLLFLISLPCRSLIPCFNFKTYLQAEQYVRENTPWLSSPMVLPA
jgi:hypothetical protein